MVFNIIFFIYLLYQYKKLINKHPIYIIFFLSKRASAPFIKPCPIKYKKINFHPFQL